MRAVCSRASRMRPRTSANIAPGKGAAAGAELTLAIERFALRSGDERFGDGFDGTRATIRQPGGETPPHTFRVAIAGGTFAPRSAGPKAASKPRTQRATTPGTST